MGGGLKVGLTQWHATADIEANVAIAVELIGKAAAEGASLVVLPENGLMLGTNTQMRARLLSESCVEVKAVCAAAAQSNVTVVLGGMKNATESGVYNSALVINRQGEIAGRYDKIHLFDAKIGGRSFEASSVEQAGSTPVLFELDSVPIGLTICYDVRFPELYRELAVAGAQVILVPAAFTYQTGSAHWQTLLQARAIENSCYIIAPATVRSELGAGHDDFESYGHALAVSPWGEVITDLGMDSPAVQVVELDLSKVDAIRSSLPVLAGRKPEVYAAPLRTIVLPGNPGEGKENS